MSKTITITAPNGAKVRTVASKQYFVVSYGNTYGKPTAFIVKRTDSPTVAWAATRGFNNSRVVYTTHQFTNEGRTHVIILAPIDIACRADNEKSTKRYLAARGRQGEARRLFY